MKCLNKKLFFVLNQANMIRKALNKTLAPPPPPPTTFPIIYLSGFEYFQVEWVEEGRSFHYLSWQLIIPVWLL